MKWGNPELVRIEKGWNSTIHDIFSAQQAEGGELWIELLFVLSLLGRVSTEQATLSVRKPYFQRLDSDKNAFMNEGYYYRLFENFCKVCF